MTATQIGSRAYSAGNRQNRQNRQDRFDRRDRRAASEPGIAGSPATGAPSINGSPAGISAIVVAAVVLITGIAPLATDMYVPAFPLVGTDLGAGASQVQLTLTTFFIGMAAGQLVGGPLSDSHGRRRPLLISLVVFTLASVLCALAPGIGLMLAARFVQGLAGGWAMVVARSVVLDLTEGDELVRTLNIVAGIGGIAPVAGPLLGGVILEVAHWRVSFWVLAVLSASMVLLVWFGVRETLPSEARHSGGWRELVRSTRTVIGHRPFIGYLVPFAFSMGITFAYVATSAFILQSMNGLSPILYSVDFAANAVGLALAQLLAAHLAGRVSTRRLIGWGLVGSAVAGGLLLVGAIWFGTPLWLALVAFFILMSAQGFVGPNSGALASQQVPKHPGAGSAALGFVQWCLAGIVAPLAGLGGEHTAVPMAVIVLVLTAGSAYALMTAARSTKTEPETADAR